MKLLAASGVFAGLLGMVSAAMAGEWLVIPFAFSTACWSAIALVSR